MDKGGGVLGPDVGVQRARVGCRSFLGCAEVGRAAAAGAIASEGADGGPIPWRCGMGHHGAAGAGPVLVFPPKPVGLFIGHTLVVHRSHYV